MKLLARIRRPRAAPVIAQPDVQCRGVTYRGRRCRLPAGPDGYCGVFHRPVIPGPPAAA